MMIQNGLRRGKLKSCSPTTQSEHGRCLGSGENGAPKARTSDPETRMETKHVSQLRPEPLMAQLHTVKMPKWLMPKVPHLHSLSQKTPSTSTFQQSRLPERCLL